MVRKIIKSDLAGLKKVLDSIELFPSEFLDDMTKDYFTNPNSDDIWFTYIEDNKPLSIGYCAPEKLTQGTYNLYALGINDKSQGKGIGGKMMDFIEKELKENSCRILIVETSGTESFQSSRNFYEKFDYTKEAVIRDFWDEGDDKVVYWKKL